MDYTFVINGNPLSRKRKAPQGACEQCKKRKKRCTHNEPSSTTDTYHQNNVQAIVSTTAEAQRPKEPSAPLENLVHSSNQRQNITQAQDAPSVSRFIGDLNPEANLVAEQDPDSGSRDKHDVGMWVGEPRRHPKDVRSGQNQHWNDGSEATATSDIPSHTVLPLLPNAEDRSALADIYFMRVNALLPIIDDDSRSQDELSIPVLQAMCLVASQDCNAEDYLRLPYSPTPLGARAFASQLYSNLKQSIRDRPERDKISLIKTLALMSLYSEGPDGAEEASMHLAQAIHHAQTIGLHLGRSSGHGRSQARLFWSLWCLSKLNAALNGRPQLISDRDIGLKIEDAYELCGPATKVLLDVSQLLSRVIEIYQPTAPPDVFGIEEDFESFENILDRCQAWDVEPTTMVSLELYYHGIAIISHRARNTTQPHPTPSPSSLRQSLSALQISSILGQIATKSLVPLPLISYSISLAMSTFYSQLRRSRNSVKSSAARENLETCVEALEELGKRSWSSMRMSGIGRKALRQTAQAAAVPATSVGIHRGSRVGERIYPAEDVQNNDSIAETNVGQGDEFMAGGAAQEQQQEAHPSGDGGDLGGFDVAAYDELMDMDAVFGDFLNMNLPDFGPSVGMSY